MNFYDIAALILAVAGTAFNIAGYKKRDSALQSLGTFVVMIAVTLAVINQI